MTDKTHLPQLVIEDTLNHKQLGHIFQNVILFANIISYHCNISQWNLSNIMNIWSALLKHQAISTYSADYVPLRFQISMG